MGKNLNPFKIIAKEFPKWWGSSETKDLRVGLEVTKEMASIPFKVMGTILDAEQVVEITTDLLAADGKGATIGVMSLVVDKHTVNVLTKEGIKDDMAKNAASVLMSKGTEMVFE